MASSPKELSFTLTYTVDNIIEPTNCQDADIEAKALETAMNIGLGSSGSSTVTQIGCATMSRDPGKCCVVKHMYNGSVYYISHSLCPSQTPIIQFVAAALQDHISERIMMAHGMLTTIAVVHPPRYMLKSPPKVVIVQTLPAFKHFTILSLPISQLLSLLET